LARVVVGGAATIMMEVMEFADVGQATFEHLRIRERGNCFDPFRIEPFDETVHELAPRPKAVPGRAATLGEACEAALESVAMNVGDARYPNGMSLVCRVGLRALLDALDATVGRSHHSHAFRPTFWQ